MLTALLLHGVLLVLFLAAYGRWLDEEIVADVCLFGLLVELVIATCLTRYMHVTDTVFFVYGGAILSQWATPQTALVLNFDEISGFFLGILNFALIFCFFFLAEYFEYDANASNIILLSALFSQAALLYFCVFDVCLLIFFWEVISFVSFLLVQHWAYRLTSYKAGLKVFSVSQFGDLPLFLFIFLLLARVGSSDMGEILNMLPQMAFEYILWEPFGLSSCFHLNTVLALLLQVAVFLKAAQWFFYPWLLDAMEAPVPISAQLHSSTLVVIGFYLFFRFQTLFDLAPVTKLVFCFVGFVTSVGASVLGFYQEDGKKLLACSTAGQLGYVMVALGLDLYAEALILLAFCCCNKAFTFVWLGVLMRRFGGISDFRYLAGQGLAWLEHAGIATAVANFTVMPGAFCWHVKGLFGHGLLPWQPGDVMVSLGLALLQLTWFLSSLYLGSLYFVLFWGSRLQTYRTTSLASHAVRLVGYMRRVLRRRPDLTVNQNIGPSGWFLGLAWLSLITLIWATGLGGCLHVDVLWVEAFERLVVACAYY